MNDNTIVISHAGVLGMKWGRRKSPTTKTVSVKKKKMKDMSNDELQNVITRKRLEKQYKEATRRPTPRAAAAVGNIIKNSANQVATEYTKDVMKKGVSSAAKGAYKRWGP